MNGNRCPRLVSILCAACIMLGSCAVTEQIQKNYQEAAESYPAPGSLGANVNETGLLVVDAVMKKALNTMPLTGVAIANVSDPGDEILSGSFKTGGFLSQLSGVVVFPNLSPGTYRIVKVRTENVNMWETTFLPGTAEFEVEIAAGTPVYFGQIAIRHPVGSTERQIAVNYDGERESLAWQMVAERYQGSEWLPAIEEQRGDRR